MSTWSAYPSNYRQAEVQGLLAAVRRGECAAVLGLSGAGKSNLLGFLADRAADAPPHCLVDCNRLLEPTAGGFWRLVRRSLEPGAAPHPTDEFGPLESSLAARFDPPGSAFCLVLDRFDALPVDLQPTVYGGLRSLRDVHKYRLTYVIASRQAVDPLSELAELFYAHTFWLGPLVEEDARWSASSYAARAGLAWDADTLARLIQLSGGYPALLRAACEAFASGCPLEGAALLAHPAVRRRLDEFWAAQPSEEELRLSRLDGIPLLARPATTEADPAAPGWVLDTGKLTAKELRLWETLLAHPGDVCAKDDLIRAVWPEDRVFFEGIRDDALAQLVRRLRQKIEEQGGPDQLIQTVPGRGYKYSPGR
jgi:hypothetical protein